MRNNLRTQNKKTAKENVDLTSYIFLCLNRHFRSFVNFKSISYCKDKVNYIPTIDRFHMTSQRPYWCTKNLERWPVEYNLRKWHPFLLALLLSGRNSILMTQINVYIINSVVMGFQIYICPILGVFWSILVKCCVHLPTSPGETASSIEKTISHKYWLFF